jgi:hypothetical protein
MDRRKERKQKQWTEEGKRKGRMEEDETEQDRKKHGEECVVSSIGTRQLRILRGFQSFGEP